jgi:16S rRNA processing protein RimM
LPGAKSETGAFVAIGRILRPRGIQGEAFFAPLTDFVERFEDLDEVLVERPDGSRSALHVEKVRAYGKRLAIKFEGLQTPEAVAALSGSLLVVRREEVHPLPEGVFYVFEIVGLNVETEAGERVGQVVDVLSMPANDVYVVRRHDGAELLLPAIQDLIRVDRAEHRLVARDVEGLL